MVAFGSKCSIHSLLTPSVGEHREDSSYHLLRALREFLHVLVCRGIGSRVPQVRLGCPSLVTDSCNASVQPKLDLSLRRWKHFKLRRLPRLHFFHVRCVNAEHAADADIFPVDRQAVLLRHAFGVRSADVYFYATVGIEPEAAFSPTLYFLRSFGMKKPSFRS